MKWSKTVQLDKRIGLSKEGEHMSFTIYARMKRIGKQKARELAPVPFVLDEKPKTEIGRAHV